MPSIRAIGLLRLTGFLSDQPETNYQHKQYPNGDAAIEDSGLLWYALNSRDCRRRRVGAIGIVLCIRRCFCRGSGLQLFDGCLTMPNGPIERIDLKHLRFSQLFLGHVPIRVK